MPTYTVGTGKTYPTIHAALIAVPANLSGTGIHTIEVYAGGTNIGDGYYYAGMVDAFQGFSNFSGANNIVIVGMVPNLGERGRGIIVNVTQSSPYGIWLGQYCRVVDISVTGDGIFSAGIYFDVWAPIP